MGEFNFDLATVPNTSPQTGGDPLNLQLLMDGAEKDVLNHNFAAIADAVNSGGSTSYVVKASNQAVTDSTTLVADTELVVALEANSVYEVRASLQFAGNVPIDAKFTLPSGASAKGNWSIVDTSVYKTSGNLVTSETLVATGTIVCPLTLTFLVITDSTAGDLGVQFALNTGTGTVTMVNTSWISSRKIA